MLDRMVAGEVPPKHHVVFRSSEGALRHEQCITRRGFDGPYTIAYHVHRPHVHEPAEARHGWRLPEPAPLDALAKRHFRTAQLPAGGPPVDARVPLLFNRDLVVSIVRPDAPDPVYFVNGDGDDLFFVHQGSGLVRTLLGDLRYERYDYVFVPKGVPYRIVPDEGEPQFWFHIEALGGLRLPQKWRNEVGQLRMDAPFCHRDFKRPHFEGPRDEGIREVLVKRSTSGLGRGFHAYRFAHSPLDVVGWDGTVYPWIFPILRFQPRAGLVHLPPDWHGTFAARGALVCSFVPRVVDFHEEAVPSPYPHSSVDCDEVLFYVEGNFLSRRGIGPTSVSYHPMGLPHGPHPGAYEASIGKHRTDELAVMIDTFEPLCPTPAAMGVEDPDYMGSFLDAR